jgi:thioredoxin-like negative regulator of GroEL
VAEDIQALADEVAGQLKVVQVNTDRQGDIVKRQRIRTLPSLQLIQNGRAVTTIQGTPGRSELMGKLSEFVDDTSNGGEDETEPPPET